MERPNKHLSERWHDITAGGTTPGGFAVVSTPTTTPNSGSRFHLPNVTQQGTLSAPPTVIGEAAPTRVAPAPIVVPIVTPLYMPQPNMGGGGGGGGSSPSDATPESAPGKDDTTMSTSTKLLIGATIISIGYLIFKK